MNLDESFRDKSVLITGAGKGIGRALTLRLAGIGSRVYALSRTESDLTALLQECPPGARVTTVVVDIRDWDKTRAAVESCGAVDVVLNVAGVGTEEPFLEITPNVFDDIINVNLKAVVNVSQTAAKMMIASGKKAGSIVNISSRLAHRAINDCSIYSCSKAGVDQLTKCMCFELGKFGIRVNSINLGGVWTPMWASTFEEGAQSGERASLDNFVNKMLPRIPAGKAFIPMEDVINTVLFTASDLTSMLTGANIPLDGGYTVT